MIKKILCILAVILQSAIAQNAKVPENTEYFYTYGGKNFDEARSVKELPNHGYIVAGTSSSFGQGNTSAYLIRTDSLGNHLWSFPYGGSQYDLAYSVEVTADSGYFVAGYSNSFNVSNDYDAWYFKTDKNGTLQWQKTVNAADWDFIYSSTKTSDGGFLLCGETYTHSNGGSDAYLVRLNANGDTLWTHHYGGSRDEKFNAIAIVGKYLIAAGSSYSISSDSTSDGWVVKLDSNGNLLNQKYAPGLYHNSYEFMGLLPVTDTSFMVCGKTFLVDSNSTQALLAKMDTSLAFTFFPAPAGPTSPGQFMCYNRMAKMSFDKVAIVGTASGGLGGLNMFIVGVRYDLSWVNGFAHDCGKQFDEFGYDVIYTSAGKLIFAGSAQQLCPASSGLGLEDAFLVRFNSDSVANAGITQTSLQCFADTLFYWEVPVTQFEGNTNLRAFPNPASEELRLELSSARTGETYNANLYSVLGDCIKSLKIEANSFLTIDLSVVPNGSYFLMLQDGNGRLLSTVKVIVTH